MYRIGNDNDPKEFRERTQKKRVRTQEWLTTNTGRLRINKGGLWCKKRKKGQTTLPQKNIWKSEITVTHVG